MRQGSYTVYGFVEMLLIFPYQVYPKSILKGLPKMGIDWILVRLALRIASSDRTL
ncbi:MAG: hypothetical protein IPI18_13475 [Saprospiraceae bacterium]|nr:hypothetical protein [Saprospiraceae bacterium]